MIKDFLFRWFPPSVDRKKLDKRLKAFYAKNADYHAMTASGDKTSHPQVSLLTSIVMQGRKYAEVGCGSGAVASLVAKHSRVDGYDVSSIAISQAKDGCPKNAEFYEASADAIPKEDEIYDGVYSFEVLEHVWNPLDAVKEMLRVTKPGGFILLSLPLHFSLDMHLVKKRKVRALECLLASLRYMYDKLHNVAYVNVRPDLEGEVYPDCDLITAVIPDAFAKRIESFGCEVEFWDTTYMCAHNKTSETDLEFQKLTANKFYRNYGDHLLLLGRKTCQDAGEICNQLGQSV